MSTSSSDVRRGDAASTRYTRTAIFLHWLVAVLVLGQFGWGWLMQEIPKSPSGIRADAFNFHKSLGLCLLALMLFRLGRRLLRPAPPWPERMPRWQRGLADTTHAMLYVALIVMPLAGYLGSVFSGYPVKWFGIALPAWGADIPTVKEAMRTTHLVTSFALLGLVSLHVGGALYHAVRGDGMLARMLPARRDRATAPRAARIAALD
jgi:cytochrome b561